MSGADSEGPGAGVSLSHRISPTRLISKRHPFLQVDGAPRESTRERKAEMMISSTFLPDLSLRPIKNSAQRPGTVAHTVIPAIWEAERGGSYGQVF